MKHLHQQFIVASIAFGFGWVFIFGAIWNVHALPLVSWVPIKSFLSATFSSAAGIVLVVFGFHGVRKEIIGHKKYKT